MNRLATRIALAMLIVALVSLLAIPTALTLADRATLATLPETYRVRFLANPPRPWTLGYWIEVRRQAPRPAPMAAVPTDAARLRDEVDQLVAFVDESRTARVEATAFAVVVALLTSIALAAWLARGIARPIAAVTNASSEIARGRFGARVRLARPAAQPRETRELAENFNAMSEAIERYEAERKAMVADVAHELRTPLAAMRLRLEALEDGLVAFDEAEARGLRGHVDLLARLVDDLRTLSLADAGRLTLAPVAVDLDAWARQAVADARVTWGQRGLELAFRGAGAAVPVRADPQRLAQVLHNLLDNAARYAPEGSTIDVGVASDGAEGRLEVRDRGPGVPEDELETIFERFVRGRRRDERGTPGSGLGLAIVRTLADVHGGRVSVRNLPLGEGGGAAFTVHLPRRSDDAVG